MANLSLRIIVALAWSLLTVIPVFGQDGLYAPSVPEDAALVRVANLQDREDSAQFDLGRVRFAPLPPGEVGAYRPVAPRIYILGGAGGVEFAPRAGRFYTIVVTQNDAPAVLSDEAHTDPVRAQLVLYNFSDASADLTAAPDEATIMEDVERERSNAIAVNAIKVDLVVRTAGQERLRRGFDLQRGESYGIFVGPARIIVSRATVSPQ